MIMSPLIITNLIFFTHCEFKIEFDNDFTTNIETPYFYNTDITDIKRYLLYEICYFLSIGHKVNNINQLTIHSISDKCNMTYKHYIIQPMLMCERQINMKIAKNPELINVLDRNKNHPLLGKYSQKLFNY